jgi:putative transposase
MDILEQDHRAIKRVTSRCSTSNRLAAGILLAGIELMHMIRSGQLVINGR